MERRFRAPGQPHPEFLDRRRRPLVGALPAAAREGERLVSAVADTGIGMTGEQVAKLFTRLGQAGISATRRFGGTGLGLPVVRASAGTPGGEVAVENEPGRGSTLTVVPPAALPAPTPARHGTDG